MIKVRFGRRSGVEIAKPSVLEIVGLALVLTALLVLFALR